VGDNRKGVRQRADLVALRQAGGDALAVSDISPKKTDATAALRGKMRALLARGVEEWLVDDYPNATRSERLKFLDLLGKYGVGPAPRQEDPGKDLGAGVRASVVMLPSLNNDAG